MIKAEVISHEGTPGPNWLDRCRSATTPVNVTVVALLIIGGALFVGLTQKDQPSTANKLPATDNSQAAPATSNVLQVEPLLPSSGSSSVQPNGSSYGGRSDNASDNENTSSATFSPESLQSYSKSKRSNGASPLNGKNDITEKLQSTVKQTQNTVNKALDDLGHGLDL